MMNAFIAFSIPQLFIRATKTIKLNLTMGQSNSLILQQLKEMKSAMDARFSAIEARITTLEAKAENNKILYFHPPKESWAKRVPSEDALVGTESSHLSCESISSTHSDHTKGKTAATAVSATAVQIRLTGEDASVLTSDGNACTTSVQLDV